MAKNLILPLILILSGCGTMMTQTGVVKALMKCEEKLRKSEQEIRKYIIEDNDICMCPFPSSRDRHFSSSLMAELNRCEKNLEQSEADLKAYKSICLQTKE